jgi:ribose 5-phosphate isomerase A
VDESKLVERLGTKTVIPVEVIPLAAPRILLRLQGSKFREKDGQRFLTDNGNVILDWKSGAIENPAALERELKGMTGVVDSGFLRMVASCVIVAGKDGVRKLEK